MENIGLVLEGGGMRGAYTAGVLEHLMNNDLYFKYVIGVSAGACNASSYVSRQIDRNRTVTVEYAGHPEYISYKKLFKQRELFGMDFIFDELPNKLVPFDYETFHSASERFVVGTTDCMTGEPVYYEKSEVKQDILTVLRASSSLPFVAPIINFDGRSLLDGGISDPIPVRKSEADGNRKNIVILTRNDGYIKSPIKGKWFLQRKYSQYPGLIESMARRHDTYNNTMRYIRQKEEEGSIFVIQPTLPLKVSRIERDKNKLDSLYVQGKKDAEGLHGELIKWLEE